MFANYSVYLIYQFTIKYNDYMKLSKIGYLALRDRNLKRKVADEMGVTENTIYRWIKINSDDLTKAGVLEVIAKETGLHVEQLLETKIQQFAA